MKLNKSDLLDALEKVKPGLANREIIEQSTCFTFLGDRVVTYNDEISVSHPVKGLNVTGAVKAQTLYAFLNKIKKDEVDFEWKENQIVIKAGRAKAGLLFENEVKLPLEEELGEIENWVPLPDKFVEGLKLCYPCASRDMSRAILTCIHLTGDIIEASDTFQIIRYRLPSEIISGESILIPATSVRELVKYDVKEMACTEAWIHFRTDEGTVFSARTIEGEFPDTAPHMEIEGDEFRFPDTMREALDKAIVFARDDLSLEEISVVTVEVKPQRITIKAKNSYGWFEEVLKSSYEGKEFTFLIGIEFLINLFDRLQTCIISSNKIGFFGENWSHVIAIQSQ